MGRQVQRLAPNLSPNAAKIGPKRGTETQNKTKRANKIDFVVRLCKQMLGGRGRARTAAPAVASRSLRRGTLRQAALAHLARLHSADSKSRLQWLDGCLSWAAAGDHCRRFLPTSFRAGHLIHSGAFAQAQPDPLLIVRSASSSWHR